MRSEEERRYWRIQAGCGTELFRADFHQHAYARHVHDRYAIGVITRGAEAFHYRGGVHIAAAGQVVVLNPDEVHDGMGADAQGWAYRMSYVPPEAFLAIENDGTALPPFFATPVLTDPPFAASFLRLHKMLDTGEASRLAQDSLLVTTLAQLAGRHASGSRQPQPARRESRAVALVRRYIDSHYAENISLEQLAAMAGLTPLYLIKAFGRAVGLPPHAYQTQCRVLAATRALRGGQSVAVVAQECGFADQSHLTRTFRRSVGVPPGAFRAGMFKHCGR